MDDDADSRGLVRAVLENNAFEVDEADGADELYALLRTAPSPGAILLDLTLVGTSGWQILRSLKAGGAHAHIPVIVVTARDDGQFRDAAIALGASAYVTKPYRTGTLLKAVRNNVRDHVADVWADGV